MLWIKKNNSSATVCKISEKIMASHNYTVRKAFTLPSADGFVLAPNGRSTFARHVSGLAVFGTAPGLLIPHTVRLSSLLLHTLQAHDILLFCTWRYLLCTSMFYGFMNSTI